ncbi:MAG: hypothetical protein KGO96_05565 [Elusimicrobia bacterium]|nr:hypothetical protein [Elusimicrobiota bacterium]MDE2236515.1 hypothetical protein [Elusimicrobiota bacterium]MDE2425357.1 hypothetical protein [Elusimicrobiota bacterium]
MRRPLTLLLAAVLTAAPALAADPPSLAPQTEPQPAAVRIRPKKVPASSSADDVDLLAPDTDVIDAPTTAVLDYGGYSSRSRFFAHGGLLEYVDFGVFQGLNIGASLTMDGLIGNDRTVRLRAPDVQVKYRFFDGQDWLPSLAAGFDGQGYDYSNLDHRYNNRQRGFFVVASEELGVPGLMIHPSINISDFDTNAFFGALPLSFDIADKVELLAEWDNINNFGDSRFNAGIRGFLSPHFAVDFAVRAIGQGGRFSNGDLRGPERVVQLRYSANF